MNYQYNSEALPPYAQNPNGSKLNSVVYGVPDSWTVSCWLVENLVNQLSDFDFIRQIFIILVTEYSKLENGAFYFKEIYVKLMNRTLKKLRIFMQNNKQTYKNNNNK